MTTADNTYPPRGQRMIQTTARCIPLWRVSFAADANISEERPQKLTIAAWTAVDAQEIAWGWMSGTSYRGAYVTSVQRAGEIVDPTACGSEWPRQ